MAILRVDIDRQRDLPVLSEILSRFGLSFEVDDEELLDESIQTALAQSESGDTRPHKQVMSEFRDRFAK